MKSAITRSSTRRRTLPNRRRTAAAARPRRTSGIENDGAIGVGLFGTYRYLAARAIVDRCLQKLGYTLDESTSTHPSWHRRALTLRREFDVNQTAQGYPRVFYMPA